MTTNNNRYVRWSLLSGIVASLCWSIGDLLLVGFAVDPNNYPLFSTTYADQVDVELATLMLEGSRRRLQWGAMIAVVSLPLYCFALYAVWQLIKRSARKHAVSLILLWIASLVFHPLGHAGFYYLGEIYKAIQATDATTHAVLLHTAKGFEQILMLNWMLALGILACVHIYLAILVYQRHTLLPRWVIGVSPVLLSAVIYFVSVLLPQPLRSWIGAAVFNEANFIFWTTLYIYVSQQIRHQRLDFNQTTNR